MMAFPSSALAGPRESYPYWEWGPDWGKADIRYSADWGARYADTETYWSSSPRLTRMERSTLYVNAYEHEVYFYNYCDSFGGCAYATGAQGYWTTLPGQVYLDTQFMDNPNEPNVTIGTADADQLQAYTYYYMDSVLVANSLWSRSKIREVRAWRPVGCWSLWCINEVNGVIVVPFNNYSVPGYIHWHY
jgi:hypothetical protein